MNRVTRHHIVGTRLAKCGCFIVLFLLASSWTLGAETDKEAQQKADDCSSISMSKIVLSAGQCQALRYFMSTFVGYAPTHVEKYEEDVSVNITPLIWLFINGRRAYLCLYAKDETICRFIRATESEPGIEKSTLDQALSREKAFAAALPVLAYCKGPADMAEYDFDFAGNGKKPSDNLEGCDWIIRHRYSYQGVLCLGPILTARVSAYSGRLESLTFWPPTFPNSYPLLPIAPEAAVQAAMKWQKTSKTAGRLRATFAPDAAKNTTKVIAWPNGGNNRDKEPAKVPSDVARYYWRVPFSWTEERFDDGVNTFNATILVDIETAEVIGIS